ncbi:DNA invertase Pin-like site-specific DNA recombinase [Conyzicola lurida]|uniref:DNA invertase Pin-like site-specific DNA recombinase n=1 Tax=Conyzicola lurida TaxID=1172621 RepID=A0A841ANI0_9MICO|nr:recombinase family protein [Conyzicola lurida]MBB5843311.1 DNA invertase Pin-like site-specific DNA recombinase [Conyzicola lurida]
MATSGVSTSGVDGQNSDLQEDALCAAGVTKTFSDLGVSGSIAKRPGLGALLEYVREGDTVVVWKLDRLGRNTRHTLGQLAEFAELGVGFRSLTEGLDTTGAMGRAMITIIAAFAELERDTIRERTVAGLAAAKARGKIGGRPKALTPGAIEWARQLHAGGHSVVEIAREVSCSRATAYRALSGE